MCKPVHSMLRLELDIPGKEKITVKIPVDVHFPERLQDQIRGDITHYGEEFLVDLIGILPEAEPAEDLLI